MTFRKEEVGVPVGSLTELLAIIEEGVIGFDRIHAFGREAGEREYGRALIAFVRDRGYGPKLARARRILHDAAAAGGGDALIAELEKALLAVPGWTEDEEAAARSARSHEPSPPDAQGGRANP